jgi:hypothetical protein
MSNMTRPRYAKGEEVELVADAWERFERALKAAARTPGTTPAKRKPEPPKKREPARRRDP